jgi:hypothetical protein
MSRRCNCAGCLARDDRRFWRIVAASTGRKPIELPPIPTWDGEPAELAVPRYRRRYGRTDIPNLEG